MISLNKKLDIIIVILDKVFTLPFEFSKEVVCGKLIQAIKLTFGKIGGYRFLNRYKVWTPKSPFTDLSQVS